MSKMINLQNTLTKDRTFVIRDAQDSKFNYEKALEVNGVTILAQVEKLDSKNKSFVDYSIQLSPYTIIEVPHTPWLKENLDKEAYFYGIKAVEIAQSKPKESESKPTE